MNIAKIWSIERYSIDIDENTDIWQQQETNFSPTPARKPVFLMCCNLLWWQEVHKVLHTCKTNQLVTDLLEASCSQKNMQTLAPKYSFFYSFSKLFPLGCYTLCTLSPPYIMSLAKISLKPEGRWKQQHAPSNLYSLKRKR